MSLLLPVALLSLTFSIATTAGVLLAVGVNDVTVIEIAGAADIPNLKVFNTSAWNIFLKAVEKWEGPRGWLLVEGDTGPWR
jgi:hypothetical protein